MGVADFDDDELVVDRELQLPVPKNYSILNPNDSDSSSDDELIPITEELTDQLISPTVQVSCSSSSTISATPSTSSNATAYKRVGITEDQARLQSSNLITKKKRSLDEEIQKKNIINEQRQSSFEKYLIDASETRKLEREMMEKREERREQRDRESQEQNRLLS